jgi:MoaA/NifB/PqqE/SkfB family radical SAM enzyme
MGASCPDSGALDISRAAQPPGALNLSGTLGPLRSGVESSRGERLSNEPSHGNQPLERLPLVTLYLSERCNSRCVTCDYWRNGRADMTLEQVMRLAPSLAALGTRTALISGGEPLLNREWREIAGLLRDRGLRLWLLTSGLSLAKHAEPAARLFDRITVSLDGACRETYAAIRGVDAFDRVLAGIRAAVTAGAAVAVRTTLQRANFRELTMLVDVAREAGASQISFLAADVANPHAFGRRDGPIREIALRPEDLPVLARILQAAARERERDFRTGFIAESPSKLGRILDYFTAVCGLGPYPPVRCNAPEFSAVVDARGGVQPCFFIPGPPRADGEPLDDEMRADLARMLNRPAMVGLREEVRRRRRPECATCVCSMWREASAG